MLLNILQSLGFGIPQILNVRFLSTCLLLIFDTNIEFFVIVSIFSLLNHNVMSKVEKHSSINNVFVYNNTPFKQELNISYFLFNNELLISVFLIMIFKYYCFITPVIWIISQSLSKEVISETQETMSWVKGLLSLNVNKYKLDDNIDIKSINYEGVSYNTKCENGETYIIGITKNDINRINNSIKIFKDTNDVLALQGASLGDSSIGVICNLLESTNCDDLSYEYESE